MRSITKIDAAIEIEPTFYIFVNSASVLSTGNVDRIALPLCWKLIGPIRFDSVYLSAQYIEM